MPLFLMDKVQFLVMYTCSASSPLLIFSIHCKAAFVTIFLSDTNKPVVVKVSGNLQPIYYFLSLAFDIIGLFLIVRKQLFSLVVRFSRYPSVEHGVPRLWSYCLTLMGNWITQTLFDYTRQTLLLSSRYITSSFWMSNVISTLSSQLIPSYSYFSLSQGKVLSALSRRGLST